MAAALPNQQKTAASLSTQRCQLHFCTTSKTSSLRRCKPFGTALITLTLRLEALSKARTSRRWHLADNDRACISKILRKNDVASCMSIVLQDIKHQILTVMKEFFASRHYATGLRVFDGLQLRVQGKKAKLADSTFRACEQAIQAQTQFSTQLAEKGMDSVRLCNARRLRRSLEASLCPVAARQVRRPLRWTNQGSGSERCSTAPGYHWACFVSSALTSRRNAERAEQLYASFTSSVLVAPMKLKPKMSHSAQRKMMARPTMSSPNQSTARATRATRARARAATRLKPQLEQTDREARPNTHSSGIRPKTNGWTPSAPSKDLQ